MSWNLLDNVTADLRFAARGLRRTPQFTLIAVFSLAFAVALIASTIAVVNAYLIRSSPYAAADRLYHVIYAQPGQREPRGMLLIDWNFLDDVAEVADSSAVTRFYLEGSYTQEAIGLSVASGAMEALGVRAVQGRSFLDEDFSANSEPVALIGHALWRDRFGSDPNIASRVFRATLNDQATEAQAFRIVGVLSPEFRYAAQLARNIDIVAPLRSPNRVYMVRLREGVPPAFAEQRVTEAAKSVALSLPAGWKAQADLGFNIEHVVRARLALPMRTYPDKASLLAFYERFFNTLAARSNAKAALTRPPFYNAPLQRVETNGGDRPGLEAGVMAYAAQQREREVAIRIALGATPPAIVQMFLKEGGIILLAGIAFGQFGARAAARLLANQLYGVQPFDILHLCAGFRRDDCGGPDSRLAAGKTRNPTQPR
jgi:putative ABC transport system permease protein